MNGFEYLLTLFGLLLGLALAEVLGGLAHALNARMRVRIGWPTAFLGIYVSCNVVAFWINGWGMRDVLSVNWPTVFAGFVLTAIAYISASLVFPKHEEDYADLDAHFERQRRIVIGGLLGCTLAMIIAYAAFMGFPHAWTPRSMVIIWSAYPAGLIAMFARSRPLVIAALIWMVALYPLSVIWRPS